MKYENGKDIFPERLLKQIQKYVSGRLVYIPSPEEKKKDWGEASGYRQYLQKRNRDIQLKFRNGVTFGQLAEEYCLSHETIKKITDLPPLIVHYCLDGFELNDGNHRYEAYTRLGIKEYYVIVWITEKEEYTDFMEKYSGYMQ